MSYETIYGEYIIGRSVIEIDDISLLKSGKQLYIVPTYGIGEMITDDLESAVDKMYEQLRWNDVAEIISEDYFSKDIWKAIANGSETYDLTHEIEIVREKIASRVEKINSDKVLEAVIDQFVEKNHEKLQESSEEKLDEFGSDYEDTIAYFYWNDDNDCVDISTRRGLGLFDIGEYNPESKKIIWFI